MHHATATVAQNGEMLHDNKSDDDKHNWTQDGMHNDYETDDQ